MSEAADYRQPDSGTGLVEPEPEYEARLRAERLQLARELHDGVASGFALVSLQAALAAHLMAASPERALEALSEIRRVSSEALSELHAILGIVRVADSIADDNPPGAGRIGTLAAMTTRAGVPTRLTVSGRRRPLPAGVDLAAYRIVQESLTNVLRHSGAAAASVLLAYEDDRLLVEIEDDGDGGSPSGAAGHGILGMHERAAALGGELDAGPRPRGGYRIRATLPLGGDR
jgi:signal transduction histidine kinase